ncbi:uncharacterized protein [Nicotiana tomentosiformis]|uniref:uncharacterized protein n=1 Tax=Nicotiana tomentosiformis TaxID=4098 RepID=UPI00388C7AFA
MVKLIQSTRKYVGLSHEDPQRHIQNFLEIMDTYNYPNVSKDYVTLTLFPFSLYGEAKEWLQKEPANSIHTWDDLARKFLIKYKKLLRDCLHHCKTDEVLGHTFVDGLDETSKMNLDSACGGSCMARPYSEIQLQLNNFTANDHNWKGDGESRRAIKQKAVGVIELDDFSSMRADIAKLPTHNHYRPQGNFNQPQKPSQQIEESTNDLLKKLFLDNQQLWTNFRNLERQIGQLASNQNTRYARALPSDTEKNPRVNAVTLRNGRELEEVPKKRKGKPIHEGELIPKATHKSKKDDASSEPVNAARPPPPFPKDCRRKMMIAYSTNFSLC